MYITHSLTWFNSQRYILCYYNIVLTRGQYFTVKNSCCRKLDIINGQLVKQFRRSNFNIQTKRAHLSFTIISNTRKNSHNASIWTIKYPTNGNSGVRWDAFKCDKTSPQN